MRFKFRKGLIILPEEDWSVSGSYSTSESKEFEEDLFSIYEYVKKTFATLSKSAKERDKIERQASTEFEISVKKVHSIIEG